ncbi:MAG: hypothetical protein KF833_16445 [Verrucomicrobiae bacterium]|nr:hypothetical protein [Verrucomicrobiae bacterium]
MTFKHAVEETPHLKDAWKPGLQALRAQDRPHIAAEDTRRLTGSADVDDALQPQEPNANRWDFGIAYQHTNRSAEVVYWVEIHTASDAEVNVVLNKLRWLKAWLKDDGKWLNEFERDFIWVSSGATSFTLNAPQRKAFAELGLQQKGKVLRIPAARAD